MGRDTLESDLAQACEEYYNGHIEQVVNSFAEGNHEDWVYGTQDKEQALIKIKIILRELDVQQIK